MRAFLLHLLLAQFVEIKRYLVALRLETPDTDVAIRLRHLAMEYRKMFFITKNSSYLFPILINYD